MTCFSGKVAFPSPVEAERTRKHIRRVHGERLHVYRCDDCRRWHLGHSGNVAEKRRVDEARSSGKRQAGGKR